jgi:hypothetical protein
MEWLLKTVDHVISVLIAHRLSALWPQFRGRLRYLPKRQAHYSDIRSRIERMPLSVTKGKTSSLVLPTFVDVDTSPVSFDSFIHTGRLERTTGGGHLSDPSTFIRDRRTVVFLATAGSGKTTFIRRQLLTYIDGAPDSRFFVQGAKLIPIYVQMKLLDNSKANPILTYIRSDFRLFAGPAGFVRLLLEC